MKTNLLKTLVMKNLVSIISSKITTSSYLVLVTENPGIKDALKEYCKERKISFITAMKNFEKAYGKKFQYLFSAVRLEVEPKDFQECLSTGTLNQYFKGEKHPSFCFQ